LRDLVLERDRKGALVASGRDRSLQLIWPEWTSRAASFAFARDTKELS
jgi:hypothetical protein